MHEHQHANTLLFNTNFALAINYSTLDAKFTWLLWCCFCFAFLFYLFFFFCFCFFLFIVNVATFGVAVAYLYIDFPELITILLLGYTCIVDVHSILLYIKHTKPVYLFTLKLNENLSLCILCILNWCSLIFTPFLSASLTLTLTLSLSLRLSRYLPVSLSLSICHSIFRYIFHALFGMVVVFVMFLFGCSYKRIWYLKSHFVLLLLLKWKYVCVCVCVCRVQNNCIEWVWFVL